MTHFGQFSSIPQMASSRPLAPAATAAVAAATPATAAGAADAVAAGAADLQLCDNKVYPFGYIG